MTTLMAFIAGLVFGIGLIVAGMVNPAKVVAFLDLGGIWDPSLAFVMVGAIAVSYVGYRYPVHRSCTVLGTALHLPAIGPVDRRLLAGSALFGVGWGLVGFCPGPALVAVATGHPKVLVFVIAMVAGMAAYELPGMSPRRIALPQPVEE